jgi:hypothetical protein
MLPSLTVTECEFEDNVSQSAEGGDEGVHFGKSSGPKQGQHVGNSGHGEPVSLSNM